MVKETAPAYRITDIAENDRPRERLEHLGAQALSEAELMAILLRVGIQGENAVQLGQRLLLEMGGLRGLQSAPFESLVQLKGLGPAKAAQIKAAIELGKRLSQSMPDEKAQVTSPKQAADLVQYEMAGLEHEELWVILLDTRNRLVAVEHLYKGALNSSPVRVAEVFRPAVLRQACALIVCHNHPSGDPSPSPEDIALTRSLVAAGKLLDLPVLDHLVIGKGSFVSMNQRGLGFGG
jgi:DNA repair protein RadC